MESKPFMGTNSDFAAQSSSSPYSDDFFNNVMGVAGQGPRSGGGDGGGEESDIFFVDEGSAVQLNGRGSAGYQSASAGARNNQPYLASYNEGTVRHVTYRYAVLSMVFPVKILHLTGCFSPKDLHSFCIICPSCYSWHLNSYTTLHCIYICR
jgi:hypothetical protein